MKQWWKWRGGDGGEGSGGGGAGADGGDGGGGGGDKVATAVMLLSCESLRTHDRPSHS